MRKSYLLPFFSLGLIVVLGTLHFTAEAFYLYWTIWWFDNMVHLLAGFAGGFIIVWFLSDFISFHLKKNSNLNSVLIIIGSVLVVGIVWEIFEYINNITPYAEGYIFDTTLDLFFDLLGATLASVIGVKRIFGTKR